MEIKNAGFKEKEVKGVKSEDRAGHSIGPLHPYKMYRKDMRRLVETICSAPGISGFSSLGYDAASAGINSFCENSE